MGATGTVSQIFRKYQSNIRGKHDVKEVETTAILGTAHVLREVLVSNTERLSGERAQTVTTE
jgi:hypothetical protein